MLHPFIQSTDLFTQLRVLGTNPATCYWAKERPKGYAERYALALASRRAPSRERREHRESKLDRDQVFLT